MKKALRRLLERLRAATDGKLGRPTSVRGDLHEPQRMQPALVPARSVTRR